MATYIDRLRNDREMLASGISSRVPEGYSIYNHMRLVDFLKDMSEDQPHIEQGTELTADHFDTEIGRRAFWLAEQGERYNIEANCCEESEPRLIRALQPDAIMNDQFKSPIILTHDGAPAAVIKRYGERTIYGFEDVPEYHIYKGLFHTAQHALEFINTPPPSAHAWQLPLQEAPLGDIEPLRFSTFTVPLDTRRGLIPIDYPQSDLTPGDMNAALRIKHETLHDHAKTALENAITL